jgi:diadenosine tetraphosphatase ApaH/serine/threonine PP2A family protein phosphatase
LGGEFLSPDEFNYVYPLTGERMMVNVGSVGQPRDGDPRACYAILTDEAVMFRRLEYPVEETISKIYREADLDNMLGDRLREGR